MNVFAFTKQSKKSFDRLPKTVRERILDKLKELKRHPDLLSMLRPLIHFDPATHRLRIGDHRLVLGFVGRKGEGSDFLVLDVGPRKDIYK
jgi:mRNA-degrading endonuclease RelE of RelBE toxin-antitoxin system